MRTLLLLAIAVVAPPSVGAAQGYRYSHEEALDMMLARIAPCLSRFEVRLDSIPYFPGIAFYRGLCRAGPSADTIMATLAIDPDSVRWHFTDWNQFRAFVKRHPPHLASPRHDFEYARVALELSGVTRAPTQIDTAPPLPFPKPYAEPFETGPWRVMITTISSGLGRPVRRSWLIQIWDGVLTAYNERTPK